MSDRRYVRQTIVAGIGDDGQSRIERAEVALGGEGLRHDVATVYAVRAGVLRVVHGSIDESSLAPSFLENPAARAVASGARAATSAL
ncbi:MAG TPA: hypothetical protein VJT73_00340, partial [Polyangiaceae bacterium]|nr:hypothetical protein [Polyangiaceae bacterium]